MRFCILSNIAYLFANLVQYFCLNKLTGAEENLTFRIIDYYLCLYDRLFKFLIYRQLAILFSC